MHALTEGQISYDPYNVEIDADPYPTYRRLRDESPLYYNERFDFWALSRFTDVDDALRDIDNLSSAKGDILEVVKAEPVMPAGVFINEDPPLHTMHRLLVSRAFTPRKMKAIEDQVRAFCAACLDPAVVRGPSRLHCRSGCPDADAGDRDAGRHARLPAAQRPQGGRAAAA